MTQAEKRKSNGSLRYLLLGSIVIALLALGLILWLRRPIPNNNRLALGDAAQTDGVIEVGVQPPAEFDGLTRGELFEQRNEMVEQYPQFLAAEYIPDDATFGDIIDGLPWWGMEGQFVHFSGEQSINGPSEESRFFLNPYILVAPDFWSAIVWGGWIWDDTLLTDAELSDPDFPYTPQPQQVMWVPAEREVSVTYNTTAWLEAVNEWSNNPLTYGELVFDLVAYNARDFNLNYIFVHYDQSTHVAKIGAVPTEPFRISHFIHQGGSCGYPGGCNNMSPSTPPIQDLLVTEAPAELVIWLWEDTPQSAEQTPDVIVRLRFE